MRVQGLLLLVVPVKTNCNILYKRIAGLLKEPYGE